MRHTVSEDVLTGLDRWILGEYSRLEREVSAAYDAFEFHVVYQKIAQFASIELSGLYHDVVKDRLYTDAAGSARRRSTQTVLYRLVTGLCQMLSPILVFTADEAWEHIPGTDVTSVHLSTWQPSMFTLTAEEQADWRHLLELRVRVLPELEKARQAKLIGKALEARVEISAAGDALSAAQSRIRDFQELLNVSELNISGTETAGITVTPAQGLKCERCWHRETEVGQDSNHPGLCPRCVQALIPTAA